MNDNFALFPLVRRHYGLAKIDPPWRFETYSEEGKGKSAEQHYECWPIERIYSLPVAELAHPDGMWVWLYTTAPMLLEAIECFKRWGVTYVSNGTWVKMTKDGTRPTFGTGCRCEALHRAQPQQRR